MRYVDEEHLRELLVRWKKEKKTPSLVDELHAVLRPLVSRQIRSRTTDYNHDDVVQTVLTHLFGVLHKVDPQDDRFTHWLAVVIKHRASGALRALRRQTPQQALLPMEEDLIPAPDPEEDNDNDVYKPLDMLVTWLTIRYPDQPTERLRRLSVVLLEHLTDSDGFKITIQAMIEASRGLRRSRVIAIYNSAMFWLRVTALEPKYIITPPDDMIRYTLIPELQALVGRETADVIYTLMLGLALTFPIRSRGSAENNSEKSDA